MPSKLSREVRRAYREDKLRQVCMLPESKFGRVFGMETVQVDVSGGWYRSSDQSDYQPEDYYHFRDNGSRVLATAHLDTVVRRNRRKPHFSDTGSGPLIVSGALDDRLGAYTILHLLPAMGITCDWLLTVGEESGASTAEHFRPGKEYDWVIEFDRGGTDVVMYQYDDEPTRQLVRDAGAKVGNGSFSDIAYLEHLNVKAFNWGVGYRGNYHSEHGYAYLCETFAMVAKYLRFHGQNAGTALPHDARRSSRYSGYGSSSYSLGSRDYGYADCVICDGRGTVDDVTWYCNKCGACQDCLEDLRSCMCYIPEGVRREIREGGYILSARTDEEAGAAAAADDAGSSGWEWEVGDGELYCRNCEKGPDACTCELDAAADDASSGRPEDDRPPFPGVTGQATVTTSSTTGWPEMSWGEYLNKRYPAQSAAGEQHGQQSLLGERLAAAVEARNTEIRAEGARRVAAIQAASSPGKRLRDALDSPDWHPEQPCPGCAVCTGPGKSAFMAGGAVHVIPAHHITSRADACPDCWHPRYVCDGNCAACVRLELEPGAHTVTRHVPGQVALEGCPRCAERDQMLAAIDRGEGWHVAAPGISGVMIMAHEPAEGWAEACKRCAARWPAPLAEPASSRAPAS